MEFPEFLLNEPYILSPYKLCVANFLLSYIEEKNFQESNSVQPNVSANNDNKNVELSLLNHCYLGFKLMMSLDCSYAELRNQLLCFDIEGKSSSSFCSPNSISSRVISRFDNYFSDIQHDGINKLHDFIRKLAKVMQRKLFHHLKPSSQSSSSLSESHSETYRINRLSMAGFYLRKLIIHFERLAFSEVVILFHHLKQYLVPEQNQFGLNQSKIPCCLPTKSAECLQSKTIHVDSNLLQRFETKLEMVRSSLPNDIREHLSLMLSEVKDSEKTTEPLEPELTLNHGNENSSAMDLDESMDLDDDDHDKTPLAKNGSNKKDNGPLISKSDPIGTAAGAVGSLNGQYASQQFLTKQVHKILTNEKTALSPPQIVDFISYYFEQHNMFYYNRFIKLNYMANLAMIKESQPASSSGTGPGGSGASGQSAGISGSSSANNSNTASGVGPNRRSKNLFQSINFYSDMHYLKFINALRVNNYTMAAECFYTYFDLKKFGTSGSSGGFGPGSAASSYSSYNSNMLGGMGPGNNVVPNNPGQINGQGGGGVGGQGGGGGNGPNTLNSNTGSNMISSGIGSSAGGGGNSGCWIQPLNSSSSNFCWSALNLAIMYAHFRHYKLAYEALADCITAAREKRDEQCLQFAMIWMLLILQQFDHQSSGNGGTSSSRGSTAGTMMSPSAGCFLRARYHNHNNVYQELNLMENLVNLIVFNEHSLPYISAMATLHLQKLHYLKPIYPSIGTAQHHFQAASGHQSANSRFEGPRRPPLTCRPLVLSVQHQMDDILMRTFTLNAAILNAYGASHLAALVSNLLLRLELFDSIGDESVVHVNENTAIAVRNLALYQWTIRGNYSGSIELLARFSRYYSTYSTDVRSIIEQAITEIKFERALYCGEWNLASRCINLVRCVSRNQSLMMQAELRRRQNEPVAALECLDSIFSPNDCSSVHSSTTSQSQSSNCNHRNNSSFDSSSGESSLLVLEPEQQQRRHSVPGHPSLTVTFQQNGKPKLLSSLGGGKSVPNSSASSTTTTQSHRLPSTLEPEEERALTSDLDPYMWLNCYLLKATILADLSRLLDCVVKAQSHGFKQLECRALLEIARLQQNLFGGYIESQNIIDAIMVRLLSNGALRDIGLAYFLTATNHFYLHQNYNHARSLIDPPLRSGHRNRSRWTSLQTAAWANKRSMLIWIRIGDKAALLESLNLASLVEHCRKNREQRNNFARKAKQTRAELLKH